MRLVDAAEDCDIMDWKKEGGALALPTRRIRMDEKEPLDRNNPKERFEDDSF